MHLLSRSAVLLLATCVPRTVLSKELKYVGEATDDPAKYPLLECESDCDGDKQCDIGLSCFYREEEESVPGCTGTGKYGKDYCFRPQPGDGVLVVTGISGIPETAYPLDECQGACHSDEDCKLGLSCMKRYEIEEIQGCSGEGIKGVSYCYKPPKGVLVKVGDEGKPESAFPLGECEGECDNDADCQPGLSCFFRPDDRRVPHCEGSGIPEKDYCYVPPEDRLVFLADEGTPEEAFPLQSCQGDCDDDEDCDSGLWCYQRREEEYETVPGCEGRGIVGMDYCYRPDRLFPFQTIDGGTQSVFPLVHGDTCSKTSKCEKCHGDCKTHDNHCRTDLGLKCLERHGSEHVPGCENGGSGDVPGSSYCVESDVKTYIPGQTSVSQHGLLLSTGLTAKLIAKTNETVKYKGGGESDDLFHLDPDGAAVFEDPNTGGWIYVSNAEVTKGGGVGAITFDAHGSVVDYKMVLEDTKRNCGGGKTWWGTWLSCEETEGGQVWEVDPHGKKEGRQTFIGGEGDKYESVAYDNRMPTKPKFFVTTDREDGPLLMFSPNHDALMTALSWNDYSDLLHSPGKTQYLVLKPENNGDTGTFVWSDDIDEGRASAAAHYMHSEGIDVRDGKVYVTCKKEKYLFILDLDNLTYERSSTQGGAFDGSPDQVARIVGDDDMLLFCEEGGESCGVHGRNSQGMFFTILEKHEPEEKCETTGLALSPDNKHLYVSFQEEGKIFDITRQDKLPFGGQRLDIKYHAT